MPERVQLSRRRGYRKPENTVVVARPTRWGNPVRIVPVHKSGPFDLERDGVGFIGQNTDLEGARRSAVARYSDLLLNHPHLVPVAIEQIRAELAGKNLACWCPLDQPCHADVLLAIANAEPCGCWECIDVVVSARTWPDNLEYPFVVCATCGNKRCPRAQSHNNACTGSNAPGQPGAERYPGIAKGRGE